MQGAVLADGSLLFSKKEQNMQVIELERWKPSDKAPRKLEYSGQPTAQEVFEELKYRLEGMGYLDRKSVV